MTSSLLSLVAMLSLCCLLLVGTAQGSTEPKSSSGNSLFWKFPPGSTALVTGGTKGIGRAVVEELAGSHFGVHVLTCARSETDLATCLAEWKAAGLPVDGIVADVSTPEGREKLVQALQEWLGGKQLNILVNNVGTNIRKPSVEYTAEDLEFIWRTNYESFFGLTTACYPLLKRSAQKGTSSVVNIGSVAGVNCMKSGSIYASTKAAMNQLTGNWACEWGLDGIRVNCVAPWYINTELAQQVLKNPDYKKSVVGCTPMGRVGEPREVSRECPYGCFNGGPWEAVYSPVRFADMSLV
jgi:Tropinone reductase 1